MRSIDDKAILAAKDDKLFSEFVHDQKYFIINCAYRTNHKYITQSDDEWSIALIAFSNAVKSYDKDKGTFLSYAELIIKRSLIDYYRTMKKFSPELTVSPNIFESNSEDENTDIGIKIEVSDKLSRPIDNAVKYEIEAANSVFEKFGFSFYALSTCSPKSAKTKEACKQAVLYVLDNPVIRSEIYQSKQLPIKLIQKNTNLPRKLLDHHRRYILAAIEILSGEYPILAEYMSFIRKEGI
jgi:RNA polymerase sigma factor